MQFKKEKGDAYRLEDFFFHYMVCACLSGIMIFLDNAYLNNVYGTDEEFIS
jgi:hypothetical protein